MHVSWSHWPAFPQSVIFHVRQDGAVELPQRLIHADAHAGCQVQAAHMLLLHGYFHHGTIPCVVVDGLHGLGGTAVVA